MNNLNLKKITILYLIIVDLSLVMTTVVEDGLGTFTGITNTKL